MMFPVKSLDLRVGERYVLHVEGGATISGLLCAVSDAHLDLAPPDIVPWGAHLRLARRQVYRAERLWQPPPRRHDPQAPLWESGQPWLVWPEGTEPEVRRRRRRKAKSKPLFPDAVEVEDAGAGGDGKTTATQAAQKARRR
jgi:hypothetical protein